MQLIDLRAQARAGAPTAASGPGLLIAAVTVAMLLSGCAAASPRSFRVDAPAVLIPAPGSDLAESREAASAPMRAAVDPPPAGTEALVMPYARRIEQWRPLIRELLREARSEGRISGGAASLDDDLVLAVIQQESGGNPSAYSRAGALGLMQVMPATYSDVMGRDAPSIRVTNQPDFQDARSNLRAGIRYLAQAMQALNGDLYWVFASYNAGISAASEWEAVGLYAVPPIGSYAQTAQYAQAALHSYLSRHPQLLTYLPEPMPVAHVPGALRLLSGEST